MPVEQQPIRVEPSARACHCFSICSSRNLLNFLGRLPPILHSASTPWQKVEIHPYVVQLDLRRQCKQTETVPLFFWDIFRLRKFMEVFKDTRGFRAPTKVLKVLTLRAAAAARFVRSL